MAVICWDYDSSLVPIEGYPTCGTLTNCFIIMIRLSFYDGNGFDFLTAVIQSNQGGLAFLLFLYLILTAIILLNGLIGIFGNAFSDDDDEEDETVNTTTNEVIVKKPVEVIDFTKATEAVIRNDKLLNRLLQEIHAMKTDIENIKAKKGKTTI